jgi:flagellar motor switch protein FliN/FliY
MSEESLPPSGAQPHEAREQTNAAAINEIPVEISIVLGTTRMQIRHVKELSRGHVIQLDRSVGELVDVYANDRLVARGELEIVDEEDKRIGVKLTEIVRETES